MFLIFSKMKIPPHYYITFLSCVWLFNPQDTLNASSSSTYRHHNTEVESIFSVQEKYGDIILWLQIPECSRLCLLLCLGGGRNLEGCIYLTHSRENTPYLAGPWPTWQQRWPVAPLIYSECSWAVMRCPAAYCHSPSRWPRARWPWAQTAWWAWAGTCYWGWLEWVRWYWWGAAFSSWSASCFSLLKCRKQSREWGLKYL